MSFADVTRQALQPTALGLEPGFGRVQFLRDLDLVQRGAGRQRARAEQQDRSVFDADLRERHLAAQRTGRNLTEREQRYRPDRGRQQQYMVDAILRDHALATYDREAPRLREADRAGR